MKKSFFSITMIVLLVISVIFFVLFFIYLFFAGSALQSTSSGTFISDWLDLLKILIIPVLVFVFSFISFFYWKKKENLNKIKNWLDSFIGQ